MHCSLEWPFVDQLDSSYEVFHIYHLFFFVRFLYRLMWLQRSSMVVISALDNRCWTLPDYRLDLFFFLRQKELLGLLNLCLIPPSAGFLPETRLKTLILERYLICSVRLQAVASHPSQTKIVKQWWFSSRDFRFGFGAASRLHILAESLSGKPRPLEPVGSVWELKWTPSSLHGCTETALSFSLCIWVQNRAKSWILGRVECRCWCFILRVKALFDPLLFHVHIPNK